MDFDMDTVSEIISRGWSTGLHIGVGGEGGIGGQMTDFPDDFHVDEVEAYSPCGSGEHVYLRIRKRGMNTMDVVRILGRIFDVPERDIGYAGLKDKHAVTSQWFSIRYHGDFGEVSGDFSGYEGMEVVEVSRHGNKLRTGHLRGNRFGIVLEGVTGDDAGILSRCSDLSEHGFVNYYGKQRFGIDGGNVSSGIDILRGTGKRMSQQSQRFCISALQSAVFNLECHLRVSEHDGEVFEGDVLQKTGGGCFVCEDAAVDRLRAAAGEVFVTGLLPGSKAMTGFGYSYELERDCSRRFGISWEERDRVVGGDLLDFGVLKRFGAGSRRVIRERVGDLVFHRLGVDRIRVEFFLPSGSYATVFLRELCGYGFNR